ncbi:MAG: NUDIX domain-containing protein [Provencibacterium sp.]|jgi:8-oxo-dGTP diphosphatase|nr:NUDIX domain-containing protein [Provencibacterium sp.]
MRSEVKALLLLEGRLLLNRCRDESGAFYYALPGGGQRPFEPMETALVREVLEETGLHIRAGRLAAVAEEISENPQERERFPEYAHRIHHIFLAEAAGPAAPVPVEPDSGQEAAEWVPLAQAQQLPLRPFQLRGRLNEILCSSGAQFHPAPLSPTDF